MKKSGLCFVLAMTMLFLLVGCSQPEDRGSLNYTTDKAGIIFQADGSVTEIIIEPFGETYYDAGELKQMIESEFSKNGIQSVSVALAEKKNETLYLQVRYNTCDDFVKYESEYLGILNWEDVEMKNVSLAEFSLDSSLSYADWHGEAYDMTKIKTPENYNVVYINHAGTYQVEGYIECISNGVKLLGNNSVEIPEGKSGYIVFNNGKGEKK